MMDYKISRLIFSKVIFCFILTNTVVAETPTVSNGAQTCYTPQQDMFMWAGATAREGSRYFSYEHIQAIANKVKSFNTSRPTDFFIAGFHGGYGLQDLIDQDARKLREATPNLNIYNYLSMTLLHNTRLAMYEDEGFDMNNWVLRATKSPENGDFQVGEPIAYSATKDMPYIDISNPDYINWLVSKISRLYQVKDSNNKQVYTGVAFDNTNMFGKLGNFGNLWRGYNHFSKYLSDEKIAALDQAIFTILDRVKAEFPNKKLIFNGFAYRNWRGGEDGRNSIYFSNARGMLNEDFCAIFNPAKKDGAYKNPLPIYMSNQMTLDDMRVAFEFPNIHKMFQLNYIHPDNPQITQDLQNYCFGLYMASVKDKNTRYGAGRYGIVETLAHSPRIPDSGCVTDVPGFNDDMFVRTYEKGLAVVNASDSTKSINLTKDSTLVSALNYSGIPKILKVGDVLEIPKRQAYFVANNQKLNFNLTREIGASCPVKNFTAVVVPQKGVNGELSLGNFSVQSDPLITFQVEENNWNADYNRGITNAYRFNIGSGTNRKSIAMGTIETPAKTFSFYIKYAVARFVTFVDNVKTSDCRYEVGIR